jgi:hypothetical protein
MPQEFLLYFARLAIAPVLIASVIGLVRYRQLILSLRYLTLLACFDSLMELTTSLLQSNFGHKVLGLTSNLFLFPFISIGEIVLLTLVYRQVLQSAAFSKVLPWLLGLFTAYALVTSFSQFGLARYAVGLAIVVNLLMLGLAGLYFRKLLNELQVEQLLRDPFFWISVGLAVYGLGNLLISLFSNYIITHCSIQLQFIIMWGVRNVFNYLLYASYCVALWLAPAQGRSVPATTSTLPRA